MKTWKTVKSNIQIVKTLDPESPESGVQKYYSSDLKCYAKTINELHGIWKGMK
jgi:hypothetical protein